MPPLHLDFWPFDLEVGVGVACDLGYPVQSFVFLGLLVFELEPMYATSDRQTDDRRRWPPNAPASHTGAGHNNNMKLVHWLLMGCGLCSASHCIYQNTIRILVYWQWHHSLLARVDEVQGPGPRDARGPECLQIFFSVGILHKKFPRWLVRFLFNWIFWPNSNFLVFKISSQKTFSLLYTVSQKTGPLRLMWHNFVY